MSIGEDRLFAAVVAEFPLDFVKLFVPRWVPLHETMQVELLDVHSFPDLAPLEPGYAEVVMRLCSTDPRGDDLVVYVGIQSQPRSPLHVRMLGWCARLDFFYGLRVLPVVVFTGDGSFDDTGVYDVRVDGGRLCGLRLRYHTIHLRRLDWRRFRRHRNPVAAAFMARMRRAPDESVEVKLQCLRSMLRLALTDDQAALLWGFVDTCVPLGEEETQRYHQLQEGWPMKEREQADRIMGSIERKGWERGIEEGRQEGMLSVLLRQVQNKLGDVPAEDRARLEALSGDQLEQLSLEIFRVTSYHEWRARVDALAK
ncbi:DUF4351 domain-containing protein [Limnochorda pilosa]|uniref:DUF4351 domain-containing protein n=1 Tax=Limnochorda pilosa TaxID=1555112 RepID=A0A0K2SN35_LIMPI|nr:DUF4351 domain-containing protein [Limnochorda pilosa]BAS28224.1 hypothetical protein LIP_2383 [Limnochorda pilosa]